MTQNLTIEGSVSEYGVILVDPNIAHWFQVVEEDTLSLQSQITDNYIENNTTVQDQIALSPVIITMRGYIGETIFKRPDVITNEFKEAPKDIINSVESKLGAITSLYPPLDNITQAAKNAAQYAEASIKRYWNIGANIKDYFGKRGKGNASATFAYEARQAVDTVQYYIVEKLKYLRNSRTLVEVSTPYGYYEDMAIQSISFNQGNTTEMSSLSVTLKQLNFATTKTTQPNEKVMAKYNAIPRTAEANHGKAQGVETDNSLLYNTLGRGAKYKNYGN